MERCFGTVDAAALSPYQRATVDLLLTYYRRAWRPVVIRDVRTAMNAVKLAGRIYRVINDWFIEAIPLEIVSRAIAQASNKGRQWIYSISYLDNAVRAQWSKAGNSNAMVGAHIIAGYPLQAIAAHLGRDIPPDTDDVIAPADHVWEGWPAELSALRSQYDALPDLDCQAGRDWRKAVLRALAAPSSEIDAQRKVWCGRYGVPYGADLAENYVMKLICRKYSIPTKARGENDNGETTT